MRMYLICASIFIRKENNEIYSAQVIFMKYYDNNLKKLISQGINLN